MNRYLNLTKNVLPVGPAFGWKHHTFLDERMNYWHCALGNYYLKAWPNNVEGTNVPWTDVSWWGVIGKTDSLAKTQIAFGRNEEESFVIKDALEEYYWTKFHPELPPVPGKSGT